MSTNTEAFTGSHDAILGAMLGLACGDALGAPAEFLTRATLHERYGHLSDMVGGGIWEPGEWTDDTAMTLCVAEGIIAAPDDPIKAIGERFLVWSASGPKDVGNTISDALRQYSSVTRRGIGGSWPWAAASQSTAAAKSGMAAGNGSLMRTLPVALAYADTPTMLRQSARISAMTHWDSQAEVCCALYCLWVRRLMRGGNRSASWQEAIREAKVIALKGNLASDETPGPSPLPDGFWKRLEGVSALPEGDLQPSGYAGYVLDCLEAAVWWVMQAETLEEALVGCVNMAGEADTVAAVAGGAAGALWGASSIPDRWLDRLYQWGRIRDVAIELAMIAH